MSSHRRHSMPHARGFRIRSQSRLPRKRVPSVKFRSTRAPSRQNSIRYPLQVDDEIKFYETEDRRFLASVEIRNLTPFAMIYKLFHSNPAIEPTEFIISSSHGSIQFDEVLSILVAPARYLSQEYMEQAVFELWIAPKAIYPWDKKGHEIGSDWPKHVKDHVIMKKVMKTIVKGSKQYIEELLMRGVQHHSQDSESIMSSVPSLSVYATRAKQLEKKRLKASKEKKAFPPNQNCNDLSSSRAVRHFVKQLMEKEKEKARLKYEGKMKKKILKHRNHHHHHQNSYHPETETLYQRETMEAGGSSTGKKIFSYFLIGAGSLVILLLFYQVSRKMYRFLFPNLHNEEKSQHYAYPIE